TESHAHAEYLSLRTSPLLILAEGRGSELVREDGRSENAFSENIPAFREQVRSYARRAEARLFRLFSTCV
ncbi:hypothetical protein, partial [Pseudomonas syringae]|uniref:hypothetical protein n=1 Tax=Pseudomonas syringae TaxID=317 RepID=UPI001CA5E06F